MLPKDQIDPDLALYFALSLRIEKIARKFETGPQSDDDMRMFTDVIRQRMEVFARLNARLTGKP